jgi:hypothetical protein
MLLSKHQEWFVTALAELARRTGTDEPLRVKVCFPKRHAGEDQRVVIKMFVGKVSGGKMTFIVKGYGKTGKPDMAYDENANANKQSGPPVSYWMLTLYFEDPCVCCLVPLPRLAAKSAA